MHEPRRVRCPASTCRALIKPRLVMCGDHWLEIPLWRLTAYWRTDRDDLYTIAGNPVPGQTPARDRVLADWVEATGGELRVEIADLKRAAA